MDGKLSIDNEPLKSAAISSDLAIHHDSSPEEDGPLSCKTESQNNSKVIQKPQQKRKMEKSKNKQIDKENISVEQASTDQMMQSVTMSLAKKEETSQATDHDKENNENQTVVEANAQGGDVKIQKEENSCKENDI